MLSFLFFPLVFTVIWLRKDSNKVHMLPLVYISLRSVLILGSSAIYLSFFLFLLYLQSIYWKNWIICLLEFPSVWYLLNAPWWCHVTYISIFVFCISRKLVVGSAQVWFNSGLIVWQEYFMHKLPQEAHLIVFLFMMSKAADEQYLDSLIIRHNSEWYAHSSIISTLISWNISAMRNFPSS